MPLVSVINDPNNEGLGNFKDNGRNVLINNKPIIVVGDQANEDQVFIDTDESPHDNPLAIIGSANVYVNNIPVHRKDDLRICGAITIVIGQSNVYANEGGGSPTSATFIGMTPEPPSAVSSAQYSTFYYNNTHIENYNTPDNIANGVDGHPELEDDGPITPISAAVTNPDCVGGGDMGAQLDQVLDESRQGQWRENGKNPNIQTLFSNVGFPQIKGDQTAWCAAFAGSMLKKNCFKFNKSLAAGSYTNYGNPVSGGITNAQRGDIVVFNRTGGTGHVAFYDGPGPTPGTFYVIGGNQSNNVTRSLRSTSDLKVNGVQRPIPA